MYKLLFVCTGNICRSPTSEGVLRHKLGAAGLAEAVQVDSAGTHGYHIGEPPDRRSVHTARKRGYDISTLRARKFSHADFNDFDLILALDSGHLRLLTEQAPPAHHARVALFLEYANHPSYTEVPDPYYGDQSGFEHVLDLSERACDSLIQSLRESLPKANL